MEILSYILSFITTILGLCEPFFKKMRTILVTNFIGNLLPGLSYLLVGVYSGSAICFFACIQVTINFFFNIKEKNIPKWLIAVYAIGFVLLNAVTFKQWYDIFALIAALLYVFSVSRTNTKAYRVLYVFNSGVWIFYDFLARAYGNLFTHITLFIATSIAIYLRDKKNKI